MPICTCTDSLLSDNAAADVAATAFCLLPGGFWACGGPHAWAGVAGSVSGVSLAVCSLLCVAGTHTGPHTTTKQKLSERTRDEYVCAYVRICTWSSISDL